MVDRALDHGRSPSRAARSTSRCRARCSPSGTRPSSTPIRRGQCARGRPAGPARDRRGGRDPRRRAQPDHHHQGARPGSGRGAGAGALRRDAGAPVFDQFHTYVNFPQIIRFTPATSPSTAASSPRHLGEADAILVLESDVPWFPQLSRPKPEARVIHVAVDPLFSRYPVRGFPADLALAGAPRLTLAALCGRARRRGWTPPRSRSGAGAGARPAPAAARRPREGTGGARGDPDRHGVGLARHR